MRGNESDGDLSTGSHWRRINCGVSFVNPGRRTRSQYRWSQGGLKGKGVIFGQGTIPEPSTLHIGREVALVARTAAFVYI
jgi:hypothetical protein